MFFPSVFFHPDSHHIIEAQSIPQRDIKAYSWSINQLLVASVVVLKKFVNLHYNRVAAGTRDIGRFNNSSQGRFARGLSVFDVLCDMHSQIHKHDLHSLLKTPNSEDSDGIPADSATSRRFFFFFHLLSAVSFIVTFFSIMCLTAWCFVGNFGPGSALLSTSWVQQFVLLLSATCPLTPWHCRLSGRLCVWGWLRTMRIYPASVPHTWLSSHQLWGAFVVWRGSFVPSLIHDPFFTPLSISALRSDAQPEMLMSSGQRRNTSAFGMQIHGEYAALE